MDCNIVEFLMVQVLARPQPFPHRFLLAIMVILHKGSIHSHCPEVKVCSQNSTDLPMMLREDFAKIFAYRDLHLLPPFRQPNV